MPRSSEPHLVLPAFIFVFFRIIKTRDVFKLMIFGLFEKHVNPPVLGLLRYPVSLEDGLYR